MPSLPSGGEQPWGLQPIPRVWWVLLLGLLSAGDVQPLGSS